MTQNANPLKLNPLQLRTLTLLQALGRIPQAMEAGPGEGEVTIRRFPAAHGDHFHLGDAVVRGADATGLTNQAVWKALEHKGLARCDVPNAVVLTIEGVVYETGIAHEILHRSSH